MSTRTPDLAPRTAPFRVYIERAEAGITWWADTDAVPGLSVAAPTLRELRALIDEAARHHLGEDAAVSLELIVAEEQPEPAPVLSEILPALPVGAAVRKAIFAAA